MKQDLAIRMALVAFGSAVMLAAATPAGVWEGSISTPNGDMGVVINLHKDGEKWAGELDVPMQNVSGLPLNDIKVDGANISFPMPGAGDPRYEGKLSEDGKTITGALNAGGQSFALNLKWKSEARAVEKPAPNSGDLQVLEGTWEGALDANGTTLHLRFNFKKGADGGITGTLDSLDQGANGLPIASIVRTGDTVTLDIRAIGGKYEGTLSKDGGALTGTFTQAGNAMPLNLQHKAPAK